MTHAWLWKIAIVTIEWSLDIAICLDRTLTFNIATTSRFQPILAIRVDRLSMIRLLFFLNRNIKLLEQECVAIHNLSKEAFVVVTYPVSTMETNTSRRQTHHLLPLYIEAAAAAAADGVTYACTVLSDQ